jgi:serine/threonine protein kinase
MKSIGKYQVIEELGGSATGKTYRARDAFRNREFAVKILQVVPGISAQAKEQFCGHLASCAELTHRHIAKVHDLGEVDEGIFVATEWRSGTDLRQFMQENRDLQLGQKLAVIAQVAEGLAFAHSRGIAHGNLKPGNIFVDGARDVSILNFGSAKWLGILLDAGCRPDGLVANYLAPEQVLGKPFDARSDIFALGLMLYEFASGKYPFSADAGLIPREIVHSAPEPLRKLDEQIPEELEQLVARALDKNPEQRLQTAEEFASGLYLAAQQLRRIASAAVAAAPPAVEHAAVDSNIHQHPSELVAAPEIPPSAPAAVLEPPSATVAVPEPPVRERPQDAQPQSRPWTSRSYANAPITKEFPSLRPAEAPGDTELPKPAVAPPPQVPSAAPAFQPPKSFLKTSEPLPVIAVVQPKTGKMKKRLLIAAVGLILAAGIVSSLVSRQNLRASQNKTHAITAVEPIVPVAKPPTPSAAPLPVTQGPKPGESGPNDLGNPEFSAKQTLNGPVRSLWESGRYAQALALVNQVLANDPTSDDARSWKNKIREAQAAEAALK